MTTPFASNLPLSVIVTAPDGLIDLMAEPFDLHAETRAAVAQTWRKKEVENPHVEGSYLVHAERENVVEAINVYVQHEDPLILQQQVLRLVAAFSQLQYTMRWTLGASIETWSCQTAEYTIDRHYEHLHNGLALFKAQVPRLPHVGYTA